MISLYDGEKMQMQADKAISCFSMVPRSADRPLLLVAGMKETAGLEIFARMEKRVHEALIKAEFCAYLQVDSSAFNISKPMFTALALARAFFV